MAQQTQVSEKADLLSQGEKLIQTGQVQKAQPQQLPQSQLSPSAQAAAEVAEKPVDAASDDTTTLLITDNTMDESLSEDQHITTDELEKEAAQLV